MEASERILRFEDIRQLEEKYRQHASAYGFPPNYNRANGDAFASLLRFHVEDSARTQQIIGTFRKNLSVIHYFDTETRMDIMVYPDGQFMTVFQLSSAQVRYLLGTGDVGGG